MVAAAAVAPTSACHRAVAYKPSDPMRRPILSALQRSIEPTHTQTSDCAIQVALNQSLICNIDIAKQESIRVHSFCALLFDLAICSRDCEFKVASWKFQIANLKYTHKHLVSVCVCLCIALHYV